MKDGRCCRLSCKRSCSDKSVRTKKERCRKGGRNRSSSEKSAHSKKSCDAGGSHKSSYNDRRAHSKKARCRNINERRVCSDKSSRSKKARNRSNSPKRNFSGKSARAQTVCHGSGSVIRCFGDNSIRSKKARRRSTSCKQSCSDKSACSQNERNRSRSRQEKLALSKNRCRRSSSCRAVDRSQRAATCSAEAGRSRSNSPTAASSLGLLWQKIQRANLARQKMKTSAGKERKQKGSSCRSLCEELRNERNHNDSNLGRLNDKLRRCLESGRRTACLRATASILEMGADVKDEHLQQMLEQAAMRPGAMQFAMVLGLVSASKSVKIGVEVFMRGLGALVQQGAPAQQIRLWLNLAIPRDSPALGPLPESFNREEQEEALRELEEASGVLTDDEEEASRRAAPRSILCFGGSLVRPELNGRYQLNEGITSQHKPVYEKIIERQRHTVESEPCQDSKGRKVGKAGRGGCRTGAPSAREIDDAEDGGTAQEAIVVHYRKTQGSPEGWYFSRKTCGGEELAWNVRESRTPPASGWLVLQKGIRLPDPLRIIGTPRSGDAGSTKDTLRVVDQIDVQMLRGRLFTPDRSEHAAEYFGHFCALLHLEHLEELRQLRRRARRAPPELNGLVCSHIFDRRVVKKADPLGWEDPGSEMGTLLLPSSTSLERLRLKKGDSVSLVEAKCEPGSRSVSGAQLEGTISDLKPAKGCEPAQMIVKVRGAWPDNAMACIWRVDRGANGTLYERQLQALISLTLKQRSPVCQLLVSAHVGGVDAWVAKWRGKGRSRATSAKGRSEDQAKDQAMARKIARSKPPGADTQKLCKALDEVAALTHLNASQSEAVRAAMQQTCAVIQGPPGTGKTHVSVQILKTWARRLRLSPLLATSDSNVAVDNIAMGLQAEGVKVLRVGRPEKVNKILDEITLEAAVERELARVAEEAAEAEAAEPLASLGASASAIQTSSEFPGTRAAPFAHKGEEEGKGKAKGKPKGCTPKVRFELQMKVLRAAEVICCTSIAAGGDFLSRFSFAGILVDEAAQATELSAVVPVILRGTQRLVLVGDQCQLPPTVQSSEAEARGLSVSLYSRMIDGGGLSPYLLDTQYRSHPLLVAFSARAFYQGRLKSGISATERPLPVGPCWPRKDVPLCFLEVEGDEQQDGDSKSNRFEAEAIVRVLREVLAGGELGVTDVGVVTPYVAQVRCLRRAAMSVVPQGTDPLLLEIASVDNFQGREKELIIFSAVRCNRSGAVGFLADWRRLNVMLTRARRGLVVCGNAKTLRTNEHWSSWLEFFNCAATGAPLPRTPSPERRLRAAEAKVEKERAEEDAAEAEAEYKFEEERKRTRKRAHSRPGRSLHSQKVPKPRKVSLPRDTRPISRRLSESPVPSYDDCFYDETKGVDVAEGYDISVSQASSPQNVDDKGAKAEALDAFARFWATSTMPKCAPQAADSSSEIELVSNS